MTNEQESLKFGSQSQIALPLSLKLKTLVHAAGSRVYSYIQLRRPRRPGKKLMSPCGSQSLSYDGNKIAAEIVRQAARCLAKFHRTHN